MESRSSSAKHIHLIAICGTGMASLAGLLKQKGFEVTGSDQNVYPPMSDQLAALGIPIHLGYRPDNIKTTKPDLVVVGNVISKDNPEVLETQSCELPLLSMAQALSDFFLADRSPIVVAGTHGKTTTAGLLAWILDRCGRSPGFFIGGILKNFGRSYQLGSGPYFVIEGDEYDTAFFDKGPKFLHYRPRRLILNAVEFDHADIYRNLDHVLESFAKLVALMPKDGLILADGESANVRGLIAKAPCRVLTFGLNGETDLGARDVAPFESPLPGRHNLKNFIGVLGILFDLGLSRKEIQSALSEFQGLKRRQEVLGVFRGVTLIDDFAHHPTAVRETLAALRSKYFKASVGRSPSERSGPLSGQTDGGLGGRAVSPPARLWAVFEPRSNTTRRNVFQRDFAVSFDAADEIVLAAPYQPEKIPEAERLHPEDVIADLRRRGKRARYIPDVDHIVDIVAKESRPGDILCIMSNGGFGGIYQKMINILK